MSSPAETDLPAKSVIKKILFKKSRAVAIFKQKWGEHVENIKKYLGS
jgi:hypothetical protein